MVNQSIKARSVHRGALVACRCLAIGWLRGAGPYIFLFNLSSIHAFFDAHQLFEQRLVLIVDLSLTLFEMSNWFCNLPFSGNGILYGFGSRFFLKIATFCTAMSASPASITGDSDFGDGSTYETD